MAETTIKVRVEVTRFGRALLWMAERLAGHVERRGPARWSRAAAWFVIWLATSTRLVARISVP